MSISVVSSCNIYAVKWTFQIRKLGFHYQNYQNGLLINLVNFILTFDRVVIKTRDFEGFILTSIYSLVYHILVYILIFWGHVEAGTANICIFINFCVIYRTVGKGQSSQPWGWPSFWNLASFVIFLTEYMQLCCNFFTKSVLFFS